MIYRGILDEKTVQISFQKPVIPAPENFIFSFGDQEISIDSIDIHDDGRVLIFQLSESIPYYDSSEREMVLQVTISNVLDIMGMHHYIQSPRIIWFPWK